MLAVLHVCALCVSHVGVCVREGGGAWAPWAPPPGSAPALSASLETRFGCFSIFSIDIEHTVICKSNLAYSVNSISTYSADDFGKELLHLI